MLRRIAGLALALFAMMACAHAATLLPPGEQTFLDNNGLPLSGGQVYFYIPNTLTPKATYKNSAASVANTNPVLLDSSGRAIIYGTGQYREQVFDSTGNLIWDQLTTDTSATSYSWGGTSGGTANAQTLSAGNFAITDGQQIGFLAGISNAGATTISVNGGSPINVVKATSSGAVALEGGEIVTGNQYLITYSAADGNFQLLSYPNAQSGTVSVLDYLPAGQPDGSTDNSAGFQAAANAMCARLSFGGTILVPSPTAGRQYKAHDINNACGNFWDGGGIGGIGSSNQTATASIQRGGASIDYSAAVNFFMRWQPTGFPAFKSSAHINGGGITHVSLFDGASTATALVSQGTQDWSATYIVMNGAYNGVYMKGDEFPVTSHISMYGTRNNNYQMVGDLSGLTASGAACSISNGDCSTRNDAWFGEYLNNIDNTQTNTVFTLTGFVATPTITHSTGEGPNIGISISCPSGLNTSLAQCPEFGRFDDVQVENFKTYGVQLSDFLTMYFDHLYSVGDGTGSNNNNLYAKSINYNYNGSTFPSPVGRLTITNSILFATGGDCALLDGVMWDIEFVNNQINGCNISNNNWNAIDSAGTVTDLKIVHNTIGEVDAYGGSHPLAHAVVVSNGTTNGVITNNFFNPSGGVGYCTLSGGVCTNNAPVTNNSASPFTIHEADNVGPGGAPTLGACGTSPSIAFGSDRSMVVNVGSGSPSTCTINFGSIWSRAPTCSTQSVAGASAVSYTGSNSSIVLSGPTNSGSYAIQCSVN